MARSMGANAAPTPEQRDQLFADAQSYGGPQRASMAMLLGSVGMDPSVEYVQAFSRHDTRHEGDLDTVLGAACSFSDDNKQVLWVGEPSPTIMRDYPDMARAWIDTLQTRKNARLYRRPPTARLLRRLLQDPSGGWSVLLHAAGTAFDGGETAVQPTFVVSRHAQQTVMVHNPGSSERPPQPNQRLSLTEALGGLSAAHARVSLLAVRLPQVADHGTRIRP